MTGIFTYYCGNTGVERIPKSESAQKGGPGEETFDHQSDALTTELSPLPMAHDDDDDVELNVLGCQGDILVDNACALFNVALRPQKP